MTFARFVRRSVPAILALLAAVPAAGAETTVDNAAPVARKPAVSAPAVAPEKSTAPTPAGGPKPDSKVEEVLVTGSSVMESVDQARFSESVVDVLSAKDFAVTGDTGVVSALGRMSGVTTVDDKFVYVRGLSERYTSTLFNGAMLPSPDPVRRVVPLDLFPAGVMDQLSVQKTYAPYLPGDFAGGSVQLKTRSVPAEREAKMSFTSEYRPGTTFTKRTWYEGSGSDWTGYDGSYRDLPGYLPPSPGSTSNLPPGVSNEQVSEALNRTFDTTNKTIAPNFKLKGSYANNVDLHLGNLGFLMGLQAENKWNHLNIYDASVSGEGQDASASDFTHEHRTINTINYSGLGALEWKPLRTQTLNATLFYNHNTDKRYIEKGTTYLRPDDLLPYDKLISDWEEETLWVAQLGGIHNLPHLYDASVDWGVSYSNASRVKPDARYYGFLVDPPANYDPATIDKSFDPTKLNTNFDSGGLGNARTWENLSDNAWDAHLDTEVPVKLSTSILSTVKVGARYFDKQRDSTRRAFRYNGAFDHMYDGDSLNTIFSDPNVGPKPGQWKLQDVTLGSDIYSAEEETIAGFLQTDTEIGSKLRWMVGGRYETSTLSTDLPNAPDFNASLDDKGFFPATELTWLFRDDLQLRGAFSQTVNRPDLREISAAIFENPETGYLEYGRAEVSVAKILNYDLRLEWYHNGSDHMQLAAFYKDMTDPIEKVGIVGTKRRTWQNAKSATLYGFEFEVKQGLSILGRWADDFYVRSNASYIYSQATSYPAGDPKNAAIPSNPKHPLQGQSPWITNFQLTWDNVPTDTEVTVAVNAFGKRLTSLAVSGNVNDHNSDSYQQPRPVLDFIVRHGTEVFGQDIDLTFKAKNLTDSVDETTAGGETERSYRKGRTFSIEIGKDF